MKNRLIIKANTNPFFANFNADLIEVEKIELDYFRMAPMDPTNIPLFLNVAIRGNTSISSNLSIYSNALPGRSDIVPIYFEIEKKYNDGTDPDSWYPVVHGIQPEKTRWSMTNAGTMSNIEIALYDENNNLITFPLNSVAQFVFCVDYSKPTFIPKDYKNNDLYINAMGS